MACRFRDPGFKVSAAGNEKTPASADATVNLRTKILDFGGFDSSRILILRGGILMAIGNFPDIVSQRILAVTGFSGETPYREMRGYTGDVKTWLE